jgi:hypothetical protein
MASHFGISAADACEEMQILFDGKYGNLMLIQ